MTEHQQRLAKAKLQTKLTRVSNAEAKARLDAFRAKLKQGASAFRAAPAAEEPEPVAEPGGEASAARTATSQHLFLRHWRRLSGRAAHAAARAPTVSTLAEPACEPGLTRADAQAYAGKVRTDLDHDALKPPAWRVDNYLDGEDSADEGLGALVGQRLVFSKATQDAMARTETVDDYSVGARCQGCRAGLGAVR